MIWFKNYTLDDLDQIYVRKSIVTLLEIKLTEIGPDYLKAIMPVDSKTHQVFGILHGGATCVLVETAGSVASGLIVDRDTHYAVGSHISVNHIRPIKSGMVIAECTPVHIGRTKHVWDVPVYAVETGKLIAKGELTCAIIEGKIQDQI